jgi:putative pyruvate formate lyase activating enzyme
MNHDQIEKNIQKLNNILTNCTLCPRMCRINRAAGKNGFCNLGKEMIISTALPHHGEEPPLSGDKGAGTIFFSSCNLRCVYCQNYQISHTTKGYQVSVSQLSDIMLELQKLDCHNIEPVTPTPHIPGIMEAFVAAKKRGLRLPLVFNCGGYERKEIISLLKGLVDIYLPDFKYGIAETGKDLSGVNDYPYQAFNSLKEMVRQVGDTLNLDENQIATSGIIVRHLVLPGNVDNSIEALRMIRRVSTCIPLSIMAQYTPIQPVENHPLLHRRITKQEYESVVNTAMDLGFEEIYTQEVDEGTLNPDFNSDHPFNWNSTGEQIHV